MAQQKVILCTFCLITLFISLNALSIIDKTNKEEIVEIIIKEFEVDAVTTNDNETIYDNETTTSTFTTTTAKTTSEPDFEATTEGKPPPKTVHVARINWEGVKNYLIISIFLIVVIVCKLGKS